MCKLWSGHLLTELSSISVERSPPIEEVISTGVVPRFIEFLTREDHPQLQVWEKCHWSIILFTLFAHQWQVWYIKSYFFFLAAVWGCLGAHQHCIWHIREYQSGGWEWCCAHLCQAPQLPQWGCPRAGMNRICRAIISFLSGTYMGWCLCCLLFYLFARLYGL